jgi:hypothetical protein
MSWILFLALFSAAQGGGIELERCTDWLHLREWADLRKHAFYDEVKRVHFRGDARTVSLFEAMPDWSKVDYLRNLKRENSARSLESMKGCR